MRAAAPVKDRPGFVGSGWGLALCCCAVEVACRIERECERCCLTRKVVSLVWSVEMGWRREKGGHTAL
jgi:hypothetical protein